MIRAFAVTIEVSVLNQAAHKWHRAGGNWPTVSEVCLGPGWIHVVVDQELHNSTDLEHLAALRIHCGGYPGDSTMKKLHQNHGNHGALPGEHHSW